MQKRLAKSLPFHPTLTLHGQPVRALGRGRRGELIWPVHGGAPEGDPPVGDPPKDDDKRFTQADIDRIATQRVEDTRRAERKTFYEVNRIPVGTSWDDAVKLVNEREAEAEKTRLAALGETDRLKEQARLAEEKATRLEQEREAEREQTKADRHKERVALLLEKAGCAVGGDFDKDPAKKTEALERATRYLGLDVPVGADSDDIRKAIEKLKGDTPGLFGTAAAAGGGSGPGDGRPGSTPPPARQKGQSASEAGKALAEKLDWKKPAKAS